MNSRPIFSALLLAALAFPLRAAEPVAAAKEAPNPERDAERAWLASLPAAPKPELTKHGLKATEIRRWKPRGAGQGVAVDDKYFYGIGNFLVGKYDKKTGERIAEWTGLRGGETIHLNSGYVENGMLILSHSNYPNLPMASSVEFFDTKTVKPVKTVSLGIQHGSLTWVEKHDGFWWGCFANYDNRGTQLGLDNRWTTLVKFDDKWQTLESWIFPAQLVAAFKPSSSSGGSFGDDGELYVTGHDAKELYVVRIPKMGSVLEYVTTIDVPFEGQAWAWDRSEKRVIYGITRESGEVVVAKIPELPAELRRKK